MGKLLQLAKPFTVDIPADVLWPLAIQTDRINHDIVILPGVKYTTLTNQEGESSVEAKGKMLGLTITWEEKPFEWIRGKYFVVERQVTSTLAGLFIEKIIAGARLEAITPDQTYVNPIIEFKTRNFIGSMVTRVMAWLINKRMKKIYERFARNYALMSPELYPLMEAPTVNKTEFDRLSRLLPAEMEFEKPLAHLREHIISAPDNEITEMRPYVLADKWNLSRDAVLRLFLYAAHVGLLDLDWCVLCPNCRVNKAPATTLRKMQTQAHCDTCLIDYTVEFDRHVELRFDVNQHIRESAEISFCTAGVYRALHVAIQARIAPGDRRNIPLTLIPSTYRVRTLPFTAQSALRIEKTGATLEDISGVDVSVKWALQEQTLVVDNQSDREYVIVVEETPWDQRDAVTAALVASLQEFRDLYPSEVLAPGVSLSIKSQTILFTDLQDSTALYDRLGDGRAYTLVRAHFNVLTQAIEKHKGAVVKTIGDAVMATFSQSADAMKAALDMQEGMIALKKEYGADLTMVKIGLHTGSCIAVNANELLDYFGSAVNIAARIQGASKGGEIVYSQAVADDSSVKTLLENIEFKPEIFERELKGISRHFTLYRLAIVKAALVPEEIQII